VPAQFPGSYVIVDSYLCDTAAFCPFPSDPAGAGYAFGNERRAVAAAIGEAVERYSGNLVPDDLRAATYRDLDNAVDPTTLALFSPAQHDEPDFPCVPFTQDMVIEWADGVDMNTGEPVAVPASLVWASYRTTPPTNPIIQAGLAAGQSLAAAQWAALCEVIERDAMTLAWNGRQGLRR
jgi:ribosomal protein S12 methylthiotransferase accessory factor